MFIESALSIIPWIVPIAMAKLDLVLENTSIMRINNPQKVGYLWIINPYNSISWDNHTRRGGSGLLNLGFVQPLVEYR